MIVSEHLQPLYQPRPPDLASMPAHCEVWPRTRSIEIKQLETQSRQKRRGIQRAGVCDGQTK